MRRRSELPLSDYALIGDGRTAALVATDGSVDWLCHGRFDRPAVFCRLLDADQGGYLQVAPETTFRTTRKYADRTNVLVTTFASATGTARITDCMPLGLDGGPMILRKVEGVSGTVPIRVELVPTFDFARASAVMEQVPGGCTARAPGAALRLACPGTMRRLAGGAAWFFALRAGQTRWIVLTFGAPPPDHEAAETALLSTLHAWERWSLRGRYPGRYEALLRRSALVLKLLTHAPTGAMVAAPTTSLPETPGGVRNWDYRFTWLRDASWLVSALMDLGYHEESMAYIDWLEALGLDRGTPSVFYDLDGNVPSEEQELCHLRGFLASRPVRMGNGAAGQDQHDVFGEVIAAIHMCWEGMPSMHPLRPGLWNLVSRLADRAAEHWDHPDHGMWEVRDRKRHFLASKLLCWTALDRALAMGHRDGLAGPLARWGTARGQLAHAILSEGFDPRLRSFKRAFDEDALDATGLLLPRYGFLPADDPRVLATVDAVWRGLSAGNGLLRRYGVADGMAGTEGAFTACSFWLADCLARQRRIDEARTVFEKVVAHASDLGLLSEEIDPAQGVLLGNYPQAFTHLALIRAALSIDRSEEVGGT